MKSIINFKGIKEWFSNIEIKKYFINYWGKLTDLSIILFIIFLVLTIIYGLFQIDRSCEKHIGNIYVDKHTQEILYLKSNKIEVKYSKYTDNILYEDELEFRRFKFDYKSGEYDKILVSSIDSIEFESCRCFNVTTNNILNLDVPYKRLQNKKIEK